MPKNSDVTRRNVLRFSAAGMVLAAPGVITSARAQNLQKITVAVSTAPIEANHHYFYYTRAQGYYKEAGIDVDIRSIQGDTNTLRAVVAGDADIGTVGAYSALSAANAGARIRSLGSFTPHFDSHVGARKEIGSLKELEGKTFAVSGIGNIAQIGPMLCIEQAGGNPDKVQWVTVGSGSARIQGLIAGAYQATAFNTVYIKRITSYDFLHVIADQAQLLPEFIYTWEVARLPLLAKKELLTAFWIATARGARWGMEHPAEATALSQQFLPEQPKEEVAFQMETYARNKHWNVNGLLPRSYWDFTTQALLRHKLLEKSPGFDGFMVNDFALAAKEKLGEG